MGIRDRGDEDGSGLVSLGETLYRSDDFAAGIHRIERGGFCPAVFRERKDEPLSLRGGRFLCVGEYRQYVLVYPFRQERPEVYHLVRSFQQFLRRAGDGQGGSEVVIDDDHLYAFRMQPFRKRG